MRHLPLKMAVVTTGLYTAQTAPEKVGFEVSSSPRLLSVASLPAASFSSTRITCILRLFTSFGKVSLSGQNGNAFASTTDSEEYRTLPGDPAFYRYVLFRMIFAATKVAPGRSMRSVHLCHTRAEKSHCYCRQRELSAKTRTHRYGLFLSKTARTCSGGVVISITIAGRLAREGRKIAVAAGGVLQGSPDLPPSLLCSENATGVTVPAISSRRRHILLA